MKKPILLMAFIMAVFVFSCTKSVEEKGFVPTTFTATMPTVPVLGDNNGGNITCEEVSTAVGCEFDYSSGRLDYEDYPGGGTIGPITWTTDGKYVDWTSTVPVKVAIIVKGGNTANVYFSGCEECVSEGSDLSAPINPNNGKPYGLSNITFCYSLCEEEETGCETAFARKTNPDYVTCFLDLDLDGDGELDFNRWGWTNGPIWNGATTYYNIYAAAGQCDVSKGTLAGTMRVEFYNGTAKIYVTMNGSYTMDETHLYIGTQMLPVNNGEYTVAPGQYPFSHDLTDATSDYYEVSGLTGPVYIVLHAVVCGFEE